MGYRDPPGTFSSPLCLEDLNVLLRILRDLFYLKSADTHQHIQELEK